MRMNIMTKLFVFILIPAVLGLCIVAWLGYRGSEATVLQLMEEECTLVLDRQKSELGTIHRLLSDAMRNVSANVRIRQLLLADPSISPADVEKLSAQARDQIKSLSDSFPLMLEAGLIDTQGSIVSHVNPKAVGTSRADRAYFKTALSGNATVENLVSRSTGKPGTVLVVPVIDEGKTIGILYALLDIATLSKDITDTVRIGKTGICYVYDGKGIMLLHPNKDVIGNDDSKVPWFATMQKQRSGMTSYQYDGKVKIAYFSYLPALDWYVVVTLEQADMLSGVRAMALNSLLVCGLASLFVSLIIFFVARSVATALAGCARVVARVAEGEMALSDQARQDLGKAGRRGDEIGVLARGIDAMVSSIRDLFAEGEKKTAAAMTATEEAHAAMKEAEAARSKAESARHEGMLAAAEQLEGIVNVISSASEELSAQIEQSERGAAEQAQRVAETATAMEEMNSTVLEVARNAGTATDVSAHTRELAATGAGVVNQAVTNIHLLQDQSLALKDDMGTLDEQAQAISRIMSVISDIADQTNLLALNAAIEAARAGDAGRGFAVVADEVRKLAEKTMASTSDVGNAIKGIQASAEKSARQVDVAVQTIDQLTEGAGKSGAALAEIVTMAESAADQVRSIATASEEQSATSEEINRAITQVSNIASETSRAMGEAAKAVSELARQSHSLGRIISDMKRS